MRVVYSATVSDIQCGFRGLYLSTVMSYMLLRNEGMQEIIQWFGYTTDYIKFSRTRPAVRLGLI